MADGEDSKAGIARTRKSRYVAGRVESIPWKCDRLIIICEKEAGGDFAALRTDFH
jgi:hypothetical protein